MPIAKTMYILNYAKYIVTAGSSYAVSYSSNYVKKASLGEERHYGERSRDKKAIYHHLNPWGLVATLSLLKFGYMRQ